MAASVGALGQLSQLENDVRAGCVLCSPRARLLAQVAAISNLVEHEELHGAEQPSDAAEANDEASLHTVFVRRALASALAKCRRVDACLACTINPCICHRLPPLRLGQHDRLVVLLHPKEFLRTTNSGKLLLLAHPSASFLVSGLPQHDAQLAAICAKSSACVLYPSPDAIPISQFRDRLRRNWQPASTPVPTGNTDRSGVDIGTLRCRGESAAPLDVIILDGTWGQARHMGRRLPAALPRVCISQGGVSLFGSTVRKQSAARQQAGRTSTVEAYAQCALELGEIPAEVGSLLCHLETFITALAPFSSRGCSPPTALTPPSTDAPFRRRAFWLLRELGRGSWNEAGREALAAVLRQPEVHGRKVRAAAGSDRAVEETGGLEWGKGGMAAVVREVQGRAVDAFPLAAGAILSLLALCAQVCWRLDPDDRATLCTDDGLARDIISFKLADVLIPPKPNASEGSWWGGGG